jgi:tetratricopeptide (TPR) repeat protein
VLEQDGDAWLVRGDLATITVPPTIQALLAARLDRLSLPERAVIERASVVGKLFGRRAVAALLSEEARPDVSEHLSALVRKELLRPDRASAPGDEVFRFRHILIRDAAYLAMPKASRAELHERHAVWLEHEQSERILEYEEVLGYHFEQAHRYSSQLRREDERTRALAARAAERLASAGRRAFGRGDMPAAVGLLTRATVLLREDDPSRLRLAPDLGAALTEVGELTQAEAVLTAAIEGPSVDRRTASLALLKRSYLRLRTGSTDAPAEVEQAAEQSIRTFEELGDELGLAEAWRRVSDLHWMASRWGARADALERALVHAQAAGDRREEAEILASLALSLWWGPTPAETAIRRCREMLEQHQGNRTLEGRTVAMLGGLLSMRGQFEEARHCYARSRALLEDVGLGLMMAINTIVSGTIEMLAGEPARAEPELRWGYDTLERMGEKAALSTLTAVLARVIHAQGRLDEAERFTHISEEAAGPHDVTSQVLFKGTRAKVFAARGSLAEAERLGEEAAARARNSDALNMRADAMLDVAEVLRLGGNGERAAPLVEEAVRLYRRKGNEVSASTAERALVALA